MRSAACRRRAAANCCAICSSAMAGPRREYDYVSSPLGRARETMELMRAAIGLDPERLSHRRAADGNVIRPLGGFHLRRTAGARGAGAGRARARQMGLRAAGRRELRAAPGARARLVREHGARQRGVGAWRRVPGADRASSIWRSPRRPRSAISGRAASTCSTATAWRATNSVQRLRGPKAERPDFRPAARAKHHLGISRI